MLAGASDVVEISRARSPSKSRDAGRVERYARMPVPITTSLTAAIIHDGAELGVEVGREVEMSIGDKIELHFRAIETQHAKYDVSGIPSHAQTSPNGDGIDVVWIPTRSDAGEHEIAITVTDGDATALREVRIHVADTHHFAFMPGVVSTAFLPNAPRLGVFWGGGVELVIYAYGQRNNPAWPSSGRFYLDLIAAPSTQPGVSAMFDAALGFDITIERNPHRKFFLPAVGLESGIAQQGQTGLWGWASPLLSTYVYWSSQARVVIKTGYQLPTNAVQDTRGIRLGASFDFAWW